MPFLKKVEAPPKAKREHVCGTPPLYALLWRGAGLTPLYGVGTRWQCGKCKKVWVVCKGYFWVDETKQVVINNVNPLPSTVKVGRIYYGG